MHKTVLSAFPQVSKTALDSLGARAHFGVLYRVETNEVTNEISLLVQSRVKPDWSGLPEHYVQEEIESILIKNITPLLKKIPKGAIFRFKMQANPTIKKSEEDKKNGSRVPLVKEEAQLEWLERKGALHGFEVLSIKINKDVPNLIISDFTVFQGKKKERKSANLLTFYSVTFEGILQIINEDKFKQALKKGIGSGKAFGFGMISLAPG